MTRLSPLRMPPLRLAGALTGLVTLAACSALPDPSDMIEGRITRKDPLPPISVTADEPLLRMVLPTRNADATMKRIGSNQGVETWISNDRITVSLLEGVIVATRGLGNDLMGADAEKTVAAMRNGGSTEYSRRLRYLTSDSHSTWVAFGCTMSRDGNLLTEQCESLRGSVTNRWWLDARGVIERSSQWVSPDVGQIEISWARR